ncbi:MAG TPA: ABC transporter permease [Candidatus Limnocylindrales bacterium]|nr:ABC transporter permease [Candidatus Limnocylindrales bacterium]
MSAQTHAAGRDRARGLVEAVFRGHATLVYVFLYLPIALVVLFSLNSGQFAGELRGISLRWYGEAFGDRFVVGALRNSLVVALVTAVCATTFGTIAALALQRVRPGLRALYDTLAYVAIVIPGIVIGIATLVFFVNVFGWLNPWLRYLWPGGPERAPVLAMGIPTIIGAHVLFTMAIVIVLVRARVAGMDRTLVEASADLFATPWGTFRQVTLPQLAPAILAGFLLSFTFSFDEYVIASFVNGTDTTLPIHVFSSIRRPPVSPKINAIASVILLISLTVLVVAGIVYRRQGRAARPADAEESASPTQA